MFKNMKYFLSLYIILFFIMVIKKISNKENNNNKSILQKNSFNNNNNNNINNNNHDITYNYKLIQDRHNNYIPYHYQQFITDCYFITNNKNLSIQYSYINYIDELNKNNLIDIIKNIGILKNIIYMNSNDTIVSYVESQKNNLIRMVNNQYDIVNLDLSFLNNKYQYEIEKEINVYDTKILTNFMFIKKEIVTQIIKDEIKNLNVLKIGYFNRPLFINKNNNIEYFQFWNRYYRVTNYWDIVYCFHLNFDIDKKEKILKYCHLLNSIEEDFFYQGYYGKCLPSLDELIKMNIYSTYAKSHQHLLKEGAIGLNVAQLEVFQKCYKNDNKYSLILEDDIYFDNDYFIILNEIFEKYQDIDILILGHCLHNNDKHTNLCDKIDNIQGYDILIPKQNINKKICMGGFYGVLLSSKAIEIYLNRFKPINNISDVLLCDIIFEIKKDFNDIEIKKTNHRLNSYIINKKIENEYSRNNYGLFGVYNKNYKDSLTYNKLNRQFNIKYFNYFIKLQKLNFKNKYHYPIYFYFGNDILKWNQLFITILMKLLNNPQITKDINQADIIVSSFFDKLNKIEVENKIYICLNGEKDEIKKYCDIGILTTKKFKHPYNIYLPQVFTSLWERRDNYKQIEIKDKSKFCAYMYSYDLKYRVDMFKLISSYKKVDALGKSCNPNIKNRNQTSRVINNEKETYNDIAVKLYQNYKFVLALENGVEIGYVTEKILNPILAGSIPIYQGPSDIFNIFNKKRMIYIPDFKKEKDLIEHIRKIDNDDNLYRQIIEENIFVDDSYLNWDNFENYLSIQLQKSLGLIGRNILITNIDNNKNNKTNNDYCYVKNYDTNYDMSIYGDVNHIKTFIDKNDKIYFNMQNILDNIKFYVINLENRKDRLNRCQEIFKKYHLEVERFNAIRPSIEDVKQCKFIDKTKLWKQDDNYLIGVTGCKMSHYQLLTKIKNENLKDKKYVCILEDDVEFLDNFLDILEKSISQIEKDNIEIDILFLTINVKDKNNLLKVNENILKIINDIKYGITTTGILYPIDRLSYIINQIENSGKEIDNTLIDKLQNRYCVYPMIAYQRESYSDILQTNVKYNFINRYKY